MRGRTPNSPPVFFRQVFSRLRKFSFMFRNSLLLRAVVVAGVACASPSFASDSTAIVVGRVIPVVGDEIENATILIEAGRIAEIGTDVEVPTGARVVRFPRGVATPGLVNGHSTTGLRVPMERMPETPFVTVLDGIDPSSPGLENARRDGVTTVHVLPSNVTRISGQGAVIRSAGRFVDSMVVKSPSAIKLSLDPPRGETRMSNRASLRRSFLRALRANSIASRDRRRETEADPRGIQGC